MFNTEQIKNLQSGLMHSIDMHVEIWNKEDGYHVVSVANYGTTKIIVKTPEEAVRAANKVEIAFLAELCDVAKEKVF